MNHKSYKCNYIKARVENTRMDYIHSQNLQANQFKISQPRINSAINTNTGSSQDNRYTYITANQDLNASILPDCNSTTAMIVRV